MQSLRRINRSHLFKEDKARSSITVLQYYRIWQYVLPLALPTRRAHLSSINRDCQKRQEVKFHYIPNRTGLSQETDRCQCCMPFTLLPSCRVLGSLSAPLLALEQRSRSLSTTISLTDPARGMKSQLALALGSHAPRIPYY